MERPLFAILIPASNSVPTLERCVRSAVEQDYENLQVGVLDNCSTDETYDALLGLEKEYRDRLFVGRLSFQCNATEHRMRCVRLVNPRALHLHFLAPEHVLLPSFVRRCMDVIEANDTVGCVMAHADIVDGVGTIRSAPRWGEGDRILEGTTQMAAFLRTGCTPNVLTCLRREVYLLARRERYTFDRHPDAMPLYVAASHMDMGYLSETLGYRGDARAVLGDRFAPTREELIERYLMLQAFASIARRVGRDPVCDALPDGLDSLGRECLRTVTAALDAGDRKAAQCFLSLAAAFRPEIAGTQDYRQLSTRVAAVAEPGR